MSIGLDNHATYIKGKKVAQIFLKFQNSYEQVDIMSNEEDKEDKKETMFDKFYKNRWYWIGLMLVLTIALELQFGSMN